MSSIGPQLPPHLQKRKRTPDDDAPESPQSKSMRPTNSEEIALDADSSDDDYGPSTGPATSKTSKHGANPPSPYPQSNTSLPKPSIGPSLPPPNSASRQPIGPAPPPAPLDTLPATNRSDSSSDSSEEDDYGPSLPTSASHASRVASLPLAGPSSSAPTPPHKRDDWMLAPPSAPSGYRERDPTKLKARKFASGRAAAGNEAHAGGVSAIWTETPEEKARRLRDAVLGRGSGDGTTMAATTETRETVAARSQGKCKAETGRSADEDKIRSFTEQTRGRSLYEEHQMRKNKAREEDAGGKGRKGEKEEEEDDDPSKRAFNWEKDMKSGGTISHTQRRQLLAKSADFGGRFDKGRYL